MISRFTFNKSNARTTTHLSADGTSRWRNVRNLPAEKNGKKFGNVNLSHSGPMSFRYTESATQLPVNQHHGENQKVMRKTEKNHEHEIFKRRASFFIFKGIIFRCMSQYAVLLSF